MTLPDDPAARHRLIGAAFTERVAGTRDWDVPSPVADWAARDVVRHLIDWFPPFLAAGAQVHLPVGPSVEDDPVAGWSHQHHLVQALLDDPGTEQRHLADPHIGVLPLPTAIDQFYTTDVFLHTWDLARATGQDDRLDPGFCERLLAAMVPMDDALRRSGHYGAAVPVPSDAPVQDRLLGFIERDPGWSAD